MSVLKMLFAKGQFAFGAIIAFAVLLSSFPLAASADSYRVALIYPGTATDLSWSNAWFDGAEQAMAANSDIHVESVELLNDPASVLQQGAAFASQGYDMVLIAHGAMVDPAITLAQQFPGVQFCLAPHHPSDATGPPTQPDNLCWIDVAQHNANFLAGALAALMTQSGHVGSLNGFAFPALTRQAEGFHLGARCVNPNIKFSQQYINTWTDTGIDGTALATGPYAMPVFVDDHNAGGGHYDEYYSAMISWFNGSTNSTNVDEIVIHRAGHASNNSDVQFRTLRASGSDSHDLMLQVKQNFAHTSTMNNTDGRKFNFKFRRLI